MVIGLVSKSPEQAVAASQSCLFFSFPKGNSFGFFKETNILTLGQLLILNSLICYWPWRAWPGFTFDTHSSLFASTRHLFLPFSSKNGKSSCSNVSTWLLAVRCICICSRWKCPTSIDERRSIVVTFLVIHIYDCVQQSLQWSPSFF